MTAAIEPRAQLPALTGMRGVAAWFVVLYHIRTRATAHLPPDVLDVFSKGYLAVDLFFMLSGFVLWLNYGDRLRKQGIAAAPRFLGRRIARIWPLHLFIFAGAIAFAATLDFMGKRNPEIWPWNELPLHLLLVHNWGFTAELSWNVPSWSISCEFAAYLLFPLLALTADWRRLSSGALLALVTLLAIGLHMLMSLGGAENLGWDIPRFGLARALFEFTMGTILCELWRRWSDRPAAPLIASGIAAVSLAALALTGAAPETLAVPLLFAALLLGIALSGDSPANPLGWRPIHYLGEISYATYLVHFLLFILFKILFVDEHVGLTLPLMALFLAFTLAASVALHHGVERPAQRALNRLIDRGFRPASFKAA